MRVLLLGGTGIVGKSITESSPPEIQLWSLSRKNPLSSQATIHQAALDVGDKRKLSESFRRINPDVVIHAANEGGVDSFEFQEEELTSSALNNMATILDEVERCKARLVLISSNAVYGRQEGPYSETSPYGPVNAYGRAKVRIEQLMLSSSVPGLIVRPIMLFGWPYCFGRENIFSFWVKQLKQGNSVKAVTDVLTRPLWTTDFARAIWTALSHDIDGALNLGGADLLSLYDFALKISVVFGFSPSAVEGVTSTHFAELAVRPRIMDYDMTRATSTIDYRPTPVGTALRVLLSENGIEPHS